MGVEDSTGRLRCRTTVTAGFRCSAFVSTLEDEVQEGGVV
jgi:hypothetical protein